MADYDFDEVEYEKALFSGAFKRPPPAPVAAIPEKPVGGFMPAFKQSIGSTVSGLGQLAGDFVPGMAVDNRLKRWGEDYVAAHPTAIHSFADVKESPWLATKEALGGAAGFMAPMLATAPVGGALKLASGAGRLAALARGAGTVVQKAGPVATMVPASFGGIREAQGPEAQSTQDKLLALGGAGVVAGIETAFGPQQWALAAMTKAGRAKLAGKFGEGALLNRVGKGALKGALVEGSEEVVQNPIEQLAAYQSPWTEENIEQTMFGGVMGALAGGAMGGGFGAISRGRDLTKPATEQEQPGVEGTTLPVGGEPADPYEAAMQDAIETVRPEASEPVAPTQKVSAKQRLEDLWAQSAPEDAPDFPTISELSADLAKTARRAAVMLEKSPKVGEAGQKALETFTKTRDTVYTAHRNEMALRPAQEAFLAEGGTTIRWAQLKKLPTEELQTKLLDLAADTASTAATPGSAYLAAYAAHQNITLEEAQNAVQERSAKSEISPVGTTGQVVAEGGEGVRPGVEGQEVAPEGKVEEVIVAANVLDTFSKKLPKQQKAVFDLVRQAAENNELDKFISPEGAWQATAMGETLGMSKQAAHKAVKDLRAKLDSAAGMDVKAALAARTKAVRATETADVERLGLSPAMQTQQTEEAELFGTEGAEPSMGTIETVGGSQGAVGEAEAPPGYVESVEPSRKTVGENQAQKLRDLAEAMRSGDLADALHEWNQQAGRLPGVTEIPTDFATMELSNEGVDLMHAVLSAYQDVQEQIEAALDAGKRFTDPIGVFENEFNRIVEERAARETGTKRLVAGEPGKARAVLEGKPEAGEGAVEPRAEPKKPVKVEVKKRRVIAKPEGDVQFSEVADGVTRLANRFNALQENVEAAETEEAATRAEAALEKFYTTVPEKILRKVMVEANKRRGAVVTDKAPLEDLIGEAELSETAGAKNPISAEVLTSRLKALFRNATLFDKIVTVYPTQADAVAKGALSEQDGFVAGWKVGNKIGLIAENIEDGKELGVFLHEVGVHLGMKKLVGEKNFEWLRERIADWAKRNDGSKESEAAKRAVKRALKSTSANKEEEVVAYMVQILVEEGITPRAAAKGTIAEWLGKFVNWARVALFKIGLNAKASFSGQNLVDLAYGAAAMELAGKPGATVTYQNKEAFEAAERHIGDRYETLSVETLPSGKVSATRIPRGFQFSELAPDRFVAPDSPSKGVWEKAGAAFDRFFNDPVTMVKEHGLGWLSMDHLVEVADGVNDKLSEYRDVSRKMQATSKEWVYKAAKIDAEWGKLSDAEAKQLSAVMRAATRAGFDPETDVEPTTEEEHKVKGLYNRLSPAAVKVYKAARDHYASARKERQVIAEGVLIAAHAEAIKNAEETKDAKKIKRAKDKLEDQLAKLGAKYKAVKGPYFPLMRLGKWYVVGMSKELAALEAIENPSDTEKNRIAALRRSEQHYTTSSYETKGQARAAEKALSRKYAATRLNRAEEKSYAAGVLSAAGLQDVEDYINSSFDKEVASEIRTMMAELYYEALPEHHALKREMKREGVHGEEQDMRRVFAVSTIKSAHYMSRLKYADDLKSSLFAIRREGKKSSDAMEYYNEVVKRTKLSMDETSTPWADKIAAVSYLAHLGMNPAFVLTNASQVAMITAPWLAARTSVAKTTAALGSAYRVTGNLIVSSYKDQGWRAELDWDGKVSKGVDDMLTTLLKRNLLDITIEHDLGATAELKHHVLGDALKIGNLPVHITELANRAVTAIAAYNLAINELKLDQAGAIEFASKAVSTTQLDYSSLNAPRHMQRVFGSAPAARIVMQFRKYQQGMLWLIGRSVYTALKSASPKEKAEARKTLLGLFTTTGVMAGSLGMPMAGTATWALTALAAFGGEDDEPWDARTEYLNWLTEVVGKDAATAIAKGIPAWMFGIDMEKRVGLGDVASPLPFMRQGKTARDDAANALLAAAGAPVSTVVDVWDGLNMFGEGDWMKGAEKVVPMKGIQNLVRGARYSMEGMTERDGDVILPPDAFSIADIGAKMAGFATTRESTYYEATSAVKAAQQAAMDARKKLLAEFAQAKIKKESTTDMMKDIRAFNKRHPEKGVRVDASSLASALKSRRLAARQRGETGLLKSKQVRPFLKEAAFAE